MSEKRQDLSKNKISLFFIQKGLFKTQKFFISLTLFKVHKSIGEKITIQMIKINKGIRDMHEHNEQAHAQENLDPNETVGTTGKSATLGNKP